jgi:DNA-binding transcriptional MerR regulator
MKDAKNAVFKSIGELAEEIDLIDKVTGKPKTHVIRFWEKKFKILKPSMVLNSHRYYSEADIDLFRRVKILLKDKGMTIKGAIKLIDDEYSIDYKKMNNISSSTKLVKIKKIIKDIKNIL